MGNEMREIPVFNRSVLKSIKIFMPYDESAFC